MTNWSLWTTVTGRQSFQKMGSCGKYSYLQDTEAGLLPLCGADLLLLFILLQCENVFSSSFYDAVKIKNVCQNAI